jgi:hypothetical protein
MTLIFHSFVDRDMFLRYTDLGVGHPAALRKFVRDCFGLQPQVSEAMDVDEGGNDGHEEDDEQGMDIDLADDESEDGYDEIFGEEESDDGCDDLGEEFEEVSNDLSF